MNFFSIKKEAQNCHCGARAYLGFKGEDKAKADEFFLECGKCGETTMYHSSPDSLIEDWKKRVGKKKKARVYARN